MKHFLMITAAVVIGVVVSQVFFNKKPEHTTTDKQSQQAIDSVSRPSPENTKPAQVTPTENSATAGLISSAPANARVFIIEPANGASITSPVTVKFGIENMTVAAAGKNIENSGHHHLLIDLEQLPDLSLPLPATDQLIHFGGAQTEASIELEPGEHTLQLLLGNYLHIPHDKPVISEKITIIVSE